MSSSSDLVSLISIHHRRITSEEFQNLTHSEQIIHLNQQLAIAEIKIKSNKTKKRKLEDHNQDLQSDNQHKNQLITTLRGKIRSTSKSLQNQIENSLRYNNIQILTTQLNSNLNTEIIRLRSIVDTTDRINLTIIDKYKPTPTSIFNNQIYANQNPVEHRPSQICRSAISGSADRTSHPASPLSK
jgi:chromosome segregation ATPase